MTTTGRQNLRLRFDHDGESTAGLEIVKRLLNEGHRDETPLDRATAESAMDALAGK
jgi:hypothetical protein